MNLAGFRKETNKESLKKKHCVTTSCRGKWQELTKVRIAFSKRLRQYFPRVRRNYLLRLFYDTFENFLRTLTFLPLTFSILNQIVSDCTPAKTSYKTFWTKVNPAAKVFMHFENSRESETANKWGFAKIALPHREKWKISLTGKKSFCKEVEEIFSLD